MRFRCLFLFGMAFVVVTSDSATAHDGYWNVAAGWWPGPRTYTQEHIPYFAKHPPVYYSHPVARPYGYFPYAYVPAARPSVVMAAAPVLVRNGYATGEVAHRAGRSASPAPLRMLNPFVGTAEEPTLLPEPPPEPET